MIAIAGFVIVTFGILVGFVWEGGHLLVLFQPAEFLIIGGAAVGSIMVATPMNILKDLIAQALGILKPGVGRQAYVDLLVMLYELFTVARKDGIMALEQHVEHPEDSEILKKYPSFTGNHHASKFLSDTMKVILSGSGVPPHDLEALMDNDLETLHELEEKSPSALQRVADSLPGMGIVAAVLGIIVTMGAIDGPVEEIGHKVGAALVGTFLGILMCYGYLAPLAAQMEIRNAEKGRYLMCLKQALLAFHKGLVGQIAVEFARRVIYDDVRPSFEEVEEACKATRNK